MVLFEIGATVSDAFCDFSSWVAFSDGETRTRDMLIALKAWRFGSISVLRAHFDLFPILISHYSDVHALTCIIRDRVFES